MKFKKLTKEQIIISIDRLTRFKLTKEKYLRVYSDILTSALIEPKLKKNDIEVMDFSVITEMVGKIINESVNSLLDPLSSVHSDSFSHQGRSVKGFNLAHKNASPLMGEAEWSSDEGGYINNALKNFENSLFINDNETQKLLNNTINYSEAIKLLSDDIPVNLKWLKVLCSTDIDTSPQPRHFRVSPQGERDSILLKERERWLLKYPLEKVILVEGITEEILLPAFSSFLGHDFYAEGIQIIAAGGKNQVVKMYYKLSQEIKLPIFVLLDRDAEENIRQIEPRLREHDRIHLVSCGEFEDLLSKSLIIKTVNSHFKNFLTIKEEDLNEDLPTAKILENIFKTKGLHEFKKAEFAKLVRDKISENTDISDEIKTIIQEINFTSETPHPNPLPQGAREKIKKSLDSNFCS